MIQRTYRVDPDDYERAMARADADGEDLSAIIRQAIVDYGRGRKVTRFSED